MYKVIKDTREQHGWWFGESDECSGTTVRKLETGDYSLEGLEDIFTIERKGTTGELSQNIFQKRFFNELERLESYKHPFLLLEFSWEDLLQFPYNSGIPKSKWRYLRAKPKYLIKAITEIELKYKVKILYAPFNGEQRANALFKYVSELYGI